MKILGNQFLTRCVLGHVLRERERERERGENKGDIWLKPKDMDFIFHLKQIKQTLL